MNKSIKRLLVFTATLGIVLTLAPQSAEGRRMNLNTRVGVVSTIAGTAWYVALDGNFRITRHISVGPSFTYTPVGDVNSFSASVLLYYHRTIGPLYVSPYVGYGYIYSSYEPSGTSISYDAEGMYLPFGIRVNFRLGVIGSINGSVFARYHDLDYGYGIGGDKFSYGAAGGINFYL